MDAKTVHLRATKLYIRVGVNNFFSKFNWRPYTKFVDTWNKNYEKISVLGQYLEVAHRYWSFQVGIAWHIGEKMGKLLFFEVTCMPEGIEDFDRGNQRWGMIY